MAMDYLKYGNYKPGDSAGMLDAVSEYDDFLPSAGAGAEAGAGMLDKLGGVANIAGGVGQAVGALSNIYGTYKQAQMAEKNYQMAKKAYNNQVARAERQDKSAEEQLRLQNMMTGAEYARDVMGEGRDAYGSYNQMTGL